QEELEIEGREDKLLHVLFSTALNDLGLYDKPMARNVQLWSHDFHLLLDGPDSGREEISTVCEMIRHGGLFGYRFMFPPMRVGTYEIYWHRPLVAYASPETGQAAVLF